MTIRTDDSTTIRDDRRGPAYDYGDQVDVAPGVPTDRVRWGPILAGTFASLTMLAVLGTLGAAIGLSSYDSGDDARYFALGAGVWGVISMLIAFGFGGWLAARSSAVRGHDNGLLNGFMVAGVGIPLLLLALDSAGALMSRDAMTNDGNVVTGRQYDSDAQPAAAVLPRESDKSDRASVNDRAARPNVSEGEARQAGRRTAWGTLLSLVLAIGAASIAGLIGARDDRYAGPDRTRANRSDGGVTVLP